MPRKRREPWFEREPNGIYYAKWFEPGERRPDGSRSKGRTKRASLGTSSDQAAPVAFAEFLLNGGPAAYSTARAGSVGLSVSVVLDDYERERIDSEAVADTTKTKLQSPFRHLRAFFGEKDVRRIDSGDCQRYLKAREDGALLTSRRILKNGTVKLVTASAGTVRKELAYLTAAVNHAIKRKRLKKDEAPIIELPPPPPARLIWLYKDEVQRLFDAAHGRAGHFVRIAYYTAGRKRSIETLSKFQVSLPMNRINLDKPGARVTRKRRPVVPIVAPLRPTIERCMQESDTEWLLGHTRSIDFAFAEAVRAAGLETLPARDMRPAGKPTPHTLRHSRATHLLQDGVDPWAVSQLLGDTLQTVLKVYAHWCGRALEEALGKAKEIGK